MLSRGTKSRESYFVTAFDSGQLRRDEVLVIDETLSPWRRNSTRRLTYTARVVIPETSTKFYIPLLTVSFLTRTRSSPFSVPDRPGILIIASCLAFIKTNAKTKRRCMIKREMNGSLEFTMHTINDGIENQLFRVS